MQAILTKFLPATNYKGTRIKATCAAGSITVDYHSVDEGGIFNDEARHVAVARMLMKKIWGGRPQEQQHDVISGCLPSGDYCHVLSTFPVAAQQMRDSIREASPHGNPWREGHACRPVLDALAGYRGVETLAL